MPNILTRLLRWIQGRQGAEEHSSFFWQTAATYGTQLLIAAVSLITSAIVARALGPAGRGQYAVAMVLAAIGVQFGNVGLHSSNSYFVAKDRALLPRLVGNSLVASLVLGGFVAAVLVAMFRFWKNAPVSGWLLWLAALWVPCGLAYLFLINLLRGLLEIRFYNVVELLNRLVSAVLIIVVVWNGAQSPETMFVAVMAGTVITLALAFWKLSRLCMERARPSMELFRSNFQLGWKAYLSCFFGFLVIRVDLLMVRSMQGAAAAGYYSIAGTMADYVLLLPTAVGAILFPKLLGMPGEQKKRALTRKAVAGTGLALLLLLLVLGVSIKLVVLVLFGKAFVPASLAFLFLAPGIFFLGLETVLVQYLNTWGFPIGVVVLWVLATALNILANLWAIPRYGINGAAVVSSISYLFALLGIIAIASAKRKGSPAVEQGIAAATN